MTIKIMTVFGTRPEAIKVAPVVWGINAHPGAWQGVNVSSSQHTDLLRPFIRQLKIDVEHDLGVMTNAQRPVDVMTKVISGVSDVFAREQPDMVLVQGDTTTGLAAALAASYADIPVGHIEAGLRTGNRRSPFPEELNRRIIGQTADLHFAATPKNVESLLNEGISADRIFMTGNPVVDSLKYILKNAAPSAALLQLLAQLEGKRLLVLTTHRRENFGDIMRGHMQAIRHFADKNPDVAVVFPVHPNPAVKSAAQDELSGHANIHLVQPLEYSDFIHLLSRAWLIVSDSGGIQEEAPTLGKPVLILRDTTERPEAVECGVAQLVGHTREKLEALLDEAATSEKWFQAARDVINPFGSGDAGQRIVNAIEQYFVANGKLKSGGSITRRDDESNVDAAGV